jgi:hypothetical protein
MYFCYAWHMTRPNHHPRSEHLNNISVGGKLSTLLITQFST